MQNILQLVIQFNNQASEPLNKFKGDFAKFAEENKQELLVLSGLYTKLSNTIKGFVSDSVVGFAGFEKSMSTVGAITQSTSEQMEQLTKTARELGSSTTLSIKIEIYYRS